MSFYLVLANGRQFEWHVQSRKPDLSQFKFAERQAILLQADGDELDQIRARFTGIPCAKGNFCKWHGDMANFIIENL